LNYLTEVLKSKAEDSIFKETDIEGAIIETINAMKK
jgi:hypothetical protein